jgi:MGT family glycosyltransferase
MGHEVTFFHSILAKSVIRAAGLKSVTLEDQSSLAELMVTPKPRLDRASGGIDTLELFRIHALKTLRLAPDAIRAAKIDALVVDQGDLAAGSVADMLRLPWVNICLSPPLLLDSSVPPPRFSWKHRSGVFARLRNFVGNQWVERRMAHLLAPVNAKRREWGLPQIKRMNDLFSGRAIISQMPKAFDFPRADPPAHLYHTGPFHDGLGRYATPFPWERLGSKPVIYASMGTVRNDRLPVFRAIAKACMDVDAQLVLSLGGMLVPPEADTFAGNPIVVQFAPQLELLKRVCLTITHGGLNTTLESLARGLPLVAIPVTDDQPAVAARVEWTGTGIAIPSARISDSRLSRALLKILREPKYREAAQSMQKEIERVDGLNMAANIISRTFEKLKTQ